VTVDALASWAKQLGGWAIPDRILKAAAESPWVLPHQVFIRRTDRQTAAPVGGSYRDAVETLSTPGSVLDVGAAAGAASLPLAGRLTEATAVDSDEALLAEYERRAAALGVPAKLVVGRWPDVADQVPPADLVVCGHVLYNVADLAPFVAALTSHARRRVVAEITERHPLVSLNLLWLRFHGIVRPEGPSADDAIAALRQLGITPRVTRWTRPPTPEYRTMAELVEVTRRRLCLPPEAVDEVATALIALGVDAGQPPDLGSSGRQLVTLTWDGAAGSGTHPE
jgi:precorrin-6B methylase 2